MAEKETLELKDAWALVRKLYSKKEEGWGCVTGLTKSGFLSFLFKGPDDVIEIVQEMSREKPMSFLAMELDQVPPPWRPLGMGVVLDEDITKLPEMPEIYGMRTISPKTMKNLMRIGKMIETRMPNEQIAYYMDRLMKDHLSQPVASFNQARMQPVSVGAYAFAPALIDISPAQRELEDKLDYELRKLQKRSHPYIA